MRTSADEISDEDINEIFLLKKSKYEAWNEQVRILVRKVFYHYQLFVENAGQELVKGGVIYEEVFSHMQGISSSEFETFWESSGSQTFKVALATKRNSLMSTLRLRVIGKQLFWGYELILLGIILIHLSLTCYYDSQLQE